MARIGVVLNRVDKENVNLRLSGSDKSDVTKLEGKSPTPRAVSPFHQFTSLKKTSSQIVTFKVMSRKTFDYYSVSFLYHRDFNNINFIHVHISHDMCAVID